MTKKNATEKERKTLGFKLGFSVTFHYLIRPCLVNKDF